MFWVFLCVVCLGGEGGAHFFLDGGVVGGVGGVGGFEEDVVHVVQGDDVDVDVRGFDADDADADFDAGDGLCGGAADAAGEAHEVVVEGGGHVEERGVGVFGQADEVAVGVGLWFDVGDEVFCFGDGVGGQFAVQHAGEDGLGHGVSGVGNRGGDGNIRVVFCKWSRVMGRVFCLVAAFWLAGCTAMLWEDEGEAVRVDAGADAIYAFGVADEAARGQLGAGSLVMMGERFWYVLFASAAADLLPVLQADLPQRFRVFDAQARAELAALPVVVSGLGDSDFSSEFCLVYPADAALLDRLEALAFFQVKGGDFVRCFAARGVVYASPRRVAPVYRFESVVPVALEKLVFRPRGGLARTVGKVLLSPVALAADALGAVSVYPVAALAVQAGGGLKVIQ